MEPEWVTYKDEGVSLEEILKTKPEIPKSPDKCNTCEKAGSTRNLWTAACSKCVSKAAVWTKYTGWEIVDGA